jgi:hypothetical protein
LERIMTSTRRCVGRGALLLALMSGSPALLGGVAQADVLGGAGPVPLPVVPAAVPLLGEPTPEPSPSASASPAASSPAAPQDPAPATDPAGAAAPAPPSAPAADQAVSASSDRGPAPVPAPAPAAPLAAVPAAQQPVRVDATGAQPLRAQPGRSPVDGAASTLALGEASAPAAASAAGTAASLAGGALPTLSSGLIELPGLPALPGLRAEHGLGPRVAVEVGQAPLIAPQAAGSSGSGEVAVLNATRAAQNQPAKPVGVVLFVMAAAAGAAGGARLRMGRRALLR